jgi:hypothetical protein
LRKKLVVAALAGLLALVTLGIATPAWASAVGCQTYLPIHNTHGDLHLKVCIRNVTPNGHGLESYSEWVCNYHDDPAHFQECNIGGAQRLYRNSTILTDQTVSGVGIGRNIWSWKVYGSLTACTTATTTASVVNPAVRFQDGTLWSIAVEYYSFSLSGSSLQPC